VLQITEIKGVTAQITNAYSDHPPFIPVTENAAPVIVIVELTAKEPQALEKHLIRAEVIPTTRLVSGISYSWTVRNQNNPN